jgi:opacity protein-like surface antigen
MRKLPAALAAFGLCALPAAMAQTPPQQSSPQAPTQQAPAQQAPTQAPPQAPAQQPPASARPGYYQFPQPAPAPPAPPAPQYPRYYQYPAYPAYPAPSPPPPPPQYVAVGPAVAEPLVHWHIGGGWSDPAGRAANYLQGGYSVGGGFSVAPVSGSPLDFRFDVNYDRNDATQELIALNQNASDSINRGREEIWSGTLDLELHLPLGDGVRAYFFGGGGAYDMTLSFGEPFYALGGHHGGGYYCDPFVGFCGGGFGEVRASSQTLTKFGWNAGAGLEVPLSSGAKWFVEGRYNRVQQSNTAVPLEFIPITMGLRF